MSKANSFMLIEKLLKNNKTYEIIPEINKSEELREFIKELWEINVKFYTEKERPNRNEICNHLAEIRDYVVQNLGPNSQLIQDIDIEIQNQSSELVAQTSYYDDLLKLKAAISWEE